MATVAKSLPFSQFSFFFHSSKRLPLPPKCFLSCSCRPFSSSPSTPHPLQYDMIISRPSSRGPISKLPPPRSKPTDSDSPDSHPELSFEDWVDKKLTQRSENNSFEGMDKSQRKYYKKREKRMYGDDSDDERRKMREKSEVVELKPEVVELRTLHKREEELFFYDAFALPWEKDKHYKMVYQLEKKYFPDHSLDKAFLDPGQSNSNSRKKRAEKGEDDKGLVFFEEGQDDGRSNDAVKDVSERKVEEFFMCLKKVPNKDAPLSGVDEPFLASRMSGLPHKWDSPAGTVVLVNKPKGVSFHCFRSL